MTATTASSLAPAHDLIAYLDASPSPWHAVAETARRLMAAGYVSLDEAERWQLEPGGRYFVTRGGASLIAFHLGKGALAEAGLRMVGAHTDSPGLRLKPKAASSSDGLLRLGVEVYGGPILATFADRDLSLAGRVMVDTPEGSQSRLLDFARPLLRLPNLAIHMNREVNEQGLKFNRQTELPLVLGLDAGDEEASAQFRHLLATELNVAVDAILAWDLCVCDTQPAALWGAAQEFIAAGRLDNLASCHAALSALLASEAGEATRLLALFDHEEVGSESAAGAGGSFLTNVIERLALACGLDTEDRHRTLARSFLVSADMAHAYHPNFPAAYEPGHKVIINGGPVIKTNASQRYSTSAETASRFLACCQRAGVPCQQYAHRSDLGCGSTIGPIVAARLGVACVDVGSPMWSMHSIRESAGVLDHGYMIVALGAMFAGV